MEIKWQEKNSMIKKFTLCAATAVDDENVREQNKKLRL